MTPALSFVIIGRRQRFEALLFLQGLAIFKAEKAQKEAESQETLRSQEGRIQVERMQMSEGKNATTSRTRGPGRLEIYFHRLPESHVDDYGVVRTIL